MEKKYPLFDIYWDQKDIDSIVNVIRRGSYWAIGPEIREFEEKLENYFDVKYAVCFNSGTSALHAVLLAYNITSGEVIVPSFSFISTANCVLLAGAKPIFAEIESESLGLDINDVKRKINGRTKAILPVHYGGKASKNIMELKKIAEKNDLILIEDNAESFGAKIDDTLVGTIGNAGMLSFCQNKIISTGEGGAIITNNEEIYKNLVLIRSHGRVEQPGSNYFSSIYEMDYIQIGYNYRMPTFCGAIGVSQIEKLEFIINTRRKIGQFYDKNLNNIPDIQVIHELKGQRTVYQLYSILLKDKAHRQPLQQYLLDNNIYTKIYFSPIHLKSYYSQNFGYQKGDLPITEGISERILTLPFSLRFTEDDQNFIIEKIKEYFQQN